MLIGAALAVLVVATGTAVILVLQLSELLRPTGVTELDINAATAGVRQVLTDPVGGYGRDDVTDVRCNNGHNPVVRKGDGFSCAVTVGGVERQVAVVFSDDAGTYEVDGPR